MFTIDIKKIISNIFSIKKSCNKKHKIITILGIKIKLLNKSFTIDKNLIQKINNKIRDNSVLIVEFNDFHREIMPGYVRYFEDLGYNVDILTTLKRDTVDCFCRINASINQYFATPATIQYFLTRNIECNKYEYIFFNSYSVFRNDISDINLYKILKIDKDKIPNNWLFVAHTVEKVDKEFITNNKTIALGANLLNLPIVNPHYFGDVRITNKNTKKTIFVISGDNMKSFAFIVDAVENLLKANITNFKIYVTGRLKHKELHNKHKKYINFLGYVNFKTLYKLIEDCDFIISGLNPENDTHNWYIKYGTSGAFQLCYGFCKPMIIPEKFADKALLGNDSSILYKSNADLAKAMKDAICMNNIEYQEKQLKIKVIEKTLYNLSLKNLHNMLKEENGKIK